ncbi:splicing regulator SDE2 isoform X3 [Larimichthys crocea]|uniref:splicing regulator SDE2 isoform X3 n=1 Tax=Larimichthys crocea TaxID=215358 RepID=UPI000F5EB405|nr:replication stress response regulator SDE2 isoform X3 [Larimichthys crocea]
MEVFVSCPGLRFCPAEFPDGSVVRDVLTRFSQQQGLSSSSVVDLYVVRDGHLSHLEERLQPGVVYHLEPRLRGGKGGFGSMLRALGAQIEKTTNREACRDLSGRRLRDVNHEKEMAEWLKKQAEREAEKEQRRLERLQRKLSQPKHQFTDPEYQQQCHDLSERLEDSVIKGLQASSSAQVKVDDGTATKRPSAEQSEQPQKKKKTTTATATACFWTGVDELLSSEDEDNNGSPSTSSSSRGAAAVTMTMQEAEPGQSSRSTEDQRPPESRDKTIRSTEDQRPPESRDKTIRSTEDQRPPESIEKTIRSTEDQRPPEESSRSEPARCLDLSSVSSVDELQSLGLDVLKEELMSRGLKFSVRGLTPDQIDPALLAKPGKTKRK